MRGIAGAAISAVVQARKRGDPFAGLGDFMERTSLVQQQAENIIDAGAVDSLCPDRRRARWEAGLRYRPVGQQLGLSLPVTQDMAPLASAGGFDEMQREYSVMGMHPTGHVMAYMRPRLGRDVLPSDALAHMPDGATVTVAGLVIRRQRPLAKAVFITLEDEFGHAPLVVWPKTYERLRNALKAPFLIVTGVVSHREGTMNIVIQDAKVMQVIERALESRNFR